MLKFVIPEPKWQALRNLKNIHFYVGDQDELGTGLRHRKDSNGRVQQSINKVMTRLYKFEHSTHTHTHTCRHIYDIIDAYTARTHIFIIYVWHTWYICIFYTSSFVKPEFVSDGKVTASTWRASRSPWRRRMDRLLTLLEIRSVSFWA